MKFRRVSGSNGEHGWGTWNGARKSSEEGGPLVELVQGSDSGKMGERMSPRDVKEVEGFGLSLTSLVILFICIKWE